MRKLQFCAHRLTFLHPGSSVTSSVVLSVVLGLALAAGNGAVSLLVLRRAYGQPTAVFLKRVFGSLGLRMLALLVIVALILWLTPVDPLGFVLAFVGGLVAALMTEMWIVLKWARVQG